MAITVRPPDEADLGALADIDSAYGAQHGLEGVVTPGSLRFFGRTEHSFVATEPFGSAETVLGFVFAQAVWSGERPQVLVARVATADRPHVATALIKALVKSAYDSGVYDLHARVPKTDGSLGSLLADELFMPDQQAAFVRVLGSRGAEAANAAQAARAEVVSSHS